MSTDLEAYSVLALADACTAYHTLSQQQGHIT